MSYGWACSVEPCILIAGPGSNESRSSHLLGVQAPSHTSWTVLSLGDCPWNCFGFETDKACQSEKRRTFEIHTDFRIQLDTVEKLAYVKNKLRSGMACLIWIILSHSEGGDSSIFLSLGPMEDILIFPWVRNL